MTAATRTHSHTLAHTRTHSQPWPPKSSSWDRKRRRWRTRSGTRGKRRATRRCCRRRRAWSRWAASRCARAALCAATSPRSTPCTGAPTRAQGIWCPPRRTANSSCGTRTPLIRWVLSQLAGFLQLLVRLLFLLESKSLLKWRVWSNDMSVFWWSQVSSLRIAWIKWIFLFLKTIPKSRNFPFWRIVKYKISSLKQRI